MGCISVVEGDTSGEIDPASVEDGVLWPVVLGGNELVIWRQRFWPHRNGFGCQYQSCARDTRTVLAVGTFEEITLALRTTDRGYSISYMWSKVSQQ